jgi:hypothetical protein
MPTLLLNTKVTWRTVLSSTCVVAICSSPAGVWTCAHRPVPSAAPEEVMSSTQLLHWSRTPSPPMLVPKSTMRSNAAPPRHAVQASTARPKPARMPAARLVRVRIVRQTNT